MRAAKRATTSFALCQVSRERRQVVLSEDEDTDTDSPDSTPPTIEVRAIDGGYFSEDEELAQILQTMAQENQLP